MKKTALFVLVGMLLALCGCDSLLNGSYVSVVPHKEQNFQPEQTLLAPQKYEDLEQILIGMVRTGQKKKTISMEDMETDWQEYIDDAVAYIKDDYPMGAYAVQEITWDVGTSGTKPVLALEIMYYRSIAEIGSVHSVKQETDVEDLLYEALCAYDFSIVFSFDNYRPIDYEQIVKDYALLNPHLIMEAPRVSVMTYPQAGEERIVELTFHYDTSRTAMRQMQEQVGLIFSASEIYVSGDADIQEKYELLYSFLMNRFDYTLQTSITPSYSLLQHGVGDNKAFASVYAAMCRQAGLICEIISGTREGDAWHWNRIEIDGQIYYVDLLRCKDNGIFTCCTEQMMTDYVWDYSSH